MHPYLVMTFLFIASKGQVVPQVETDDRFCEPEANTDFITTGQNMQSHLSAIC